MSFNNKNSYHREQNTEKKSSKRTGEFIIDKSSKTSERNNVLVAIESHNRNF